MTKQETSDFIDKIKAYFPAWNPKVTPRQLLESWYCVLRKYDLAAVEDMLDKYIRENETGYAPAVSQILPKQKNGFNGRIYSHADFVEMEQDALRSLYG